MTGSTWFTFLGVALLAYVVPGPDFLVVLRSSLSSRRNGLAAGLGAQCGLCVHATLAVAGLSVVLARYPATLTAVRYLGAAYLAWLGLQAWRNAGSTAAEGDPARSARRAFVRGCASNVLNPKAVLFFAAVLPQFLTPATATPGSIAALGAADVGVGLVAWTGLVLASIPLAKLLRRPEVAKAWDRSTGAGFVGLGAGMALVRTA